jgi:hypothetical protein
MQGPAPAFAAQQHLGGMREIHLVLSHHRLGEACILDHRIQLEVAEPARDVQVARADPRPPPVGYRRLGVHHRALPFKDPDARLQQRAVSRP